MTDWIRIRTENGVASTYLFDGSGDSPAGITVPGSTAVLEWYVTLPGGVMRTVKAGAADVWLYPNLHGDTLVTVNAVGQKVTGPFVYGPYGEQIGASQADVTGLSADYGWVGQHLKATETALDNIVQMGARPYHPGLGRFLSVDPVEGGTPNDYVYVTDPVNSFDLNGMYWGESKVNGVKDAVKAVASDPVGTVVHHRHLILDIATGMAAAAAVGLCGVTLVCAAVVVGLVGGGVLAHQGADRLVDDGERNQTWRQSLGHSAGSTMSGLLCGGAMGRGCAFGVGLGSRVLPLALRNRVVLAASVVVFAQVVKVVISKVPLRPKIVLGNHKFFW